MGNEKLPAFDDLSGPDDSGPLYTETIDLGELQSEDAGLFDTYYDTGASLPESINKLLHAVPIPALLVNTGYSIIFLNESFRKISSKYRKLKGTPFLKLFPREEDARKVHELMDQVFVHRTPQVSEGILEVQGSRIWCRLNMRSLRFGRERAVLGLIEDLTLEKKQLLLNARHRKILRAARDELEKRVTERTAELKEINLRLKKEVSERKRAETELRQAHSQLERRVAERTAELRKINHQLRLEILERKRAEEKLSLDAKIIESSNEAILVTDPEGRLVDVNASFCSTTGYAQHEVLGKNLDLIRSRQQPAELYADMWDTVRQTGQWQGEVWNRRKNGEIYPVLLSMSAVVNDQEEVTHYVGIFSDITRIKQTEERLQQLAHNDPLTGLPNRTLFQDRLQQALLQADRNNRLTVLMLLDLDHFKNINDTFGHKVGDELLCSVGRRLQRCVRKSDTVARLGGDEFTVILTDISHPQVAAPVGAKIIKALSEPFDIENRQFFITASIGITVYPHDATQGDRLLQNADTALYHAKQLGRDNCQFFSEEMNQRVLERLELELELRAALERNEFLLHYQPIIDFTTGTIVCAEALLRWNNPRYGLLSPDTFIPIAEETGLIIPIGEWVLQTACAQNHVWQQLGFDPIPVSVNVSGRQLRQQGVVARFLEILREAGLPPQYLELELTESVADGDPDETVRLFGELKSNGINLSIDDFGTGYSSLSYLKRFPIERLKIDRSFVKDLGTDPDDSAIVKAIVEVAHSLKVKVVAEGVETKEQLEMLRAYGCDAWQGFSYSKPVDAEEFTSFLLQGPAPTDEQFAEALAPRELPAMFGLQPPNVVPSVSRGVIDPRPPGVYRFNGFDPFT